MIRGEKTVLQCRPTFASIFSNFIFSQIISAKSYHSCFIFLNVAMLEKTQLK